METYRQKAERALGKPLASKHPVHHVDANRAHNENTNLHVRFYSQQHSDLIDYFIF